MTLTKQQLKQLELLDVCPEKLRKGILEKLPNSGIKAICECSLNVLKGNVPLSERQKSCLSKHKNVLRRISNKKCPLHTKRKLIVQNGGFLNVLIPAALTAITGLINGFR